MFYEKLSIKVNVSVVLIIQKFHLIGEDFIDTPYKKYLI